MAVLVACGVASMRVQKFNCYTGRSYYAGGIGGTAKSLPGRQYRVIVEIHCRGGVFECLTLAGGVLGCFETIAPLRKMPFDPEA